MVSSRAERLTAHRHVCGTLAQLGDRELAQLVAAAPATGAGIGGTGALLDVDGVPVFVKRLPLTALEQRPEHLRSTANLFGLPTFCHYGIGSPGFGSWREVAAHTWATGWVLAGAHDGFTLLHHWRVLPAVGSGLPDELADVERTVAYWEGSPAVRARLTALAGAEASVLLFQEYVPQNLDRWLTERLAEGGAAAEGACALVERELAATTAFMNARGLLHFDGHFENVMTDGERLYFTDFGLAISNRFALTPAESAFHRTHATYDRCYTVTHFTHWLARAAHTHPLPPAATEIIARYTPIADVMADFYRALQKESRRTPYPVERIRRIGVASGLLDG
ncbi:protein kinase family protein [Kitasatospora nipponensis]